MSRTFDGASKIYRNTAGAAADPFTLSCWYRSTDSDTNQYVMSQGQSGALDEWCGIAVRGDEENDVVRAYARDAGAVLNVDDGTTGYTINTWQHLLATYDDDTVTLYLGGALIASDTGTFTPTTLNRIAIGALYRTSDSLPFIGQLAEAACYDAVTTAPNIALLAAGRYPYLVQADDLTIYQSLANGLNQTNDVGTMIDDGTSHSALHPTMNDGTSGETTTPAQLRDLRILGAI